MQTVNVLVFSDLAGGAHPYEDGTVAVHFHQTNPARPTVLVDGPLWAFIDREPGGLSGLEVCRRLRCEPQTAHAFIIMPADDMLTVDRRSARQVGVSEFLASPITRASVLERVLSDQRPLGGHSPLKLGALTIDPSTYQARWRSKPLNLMPTQRRLLHVLAASPGRIFTRKQLIELLDNLDTQVEERTIDVSVGRLRRVLRDAGAGNPLRTVRSLGYVLDSPN